MLPGNRPAPNYDPTKTNTLEVASAGNFGRGGSLTVDGGDNNDEVVGGTLANFPEDGIKEFQIATNRFTAEVGRSGSSLINIVTKSGTNDYHGSAFFFFRHKVLQGLPATFDHSQPTPRFVREQFGGSVGGPIKKGRAWWFVAVEDRNQNAAVLTGTRNFATDSIVGSSAPEELRDFLLTARTDFRLDDKDNLAVRYSFNRSRELGQASLRKPIGTEAQRQNSLNRFNSMLADWDRVVSNNKVNSLLFHVDTFLNEIPAFPNGNPLTSPAGLAAGHELRFPSLQDGESFRIPQQTPMNRYQVRENFTWTAGKHTVRFGGEWQNFGAGVVFDLFGSGRIDLTQDFATQDRNGDGVIDDRDIPIAFTIQSGAPVRPPSAPPVRNNYFGLFIQDDWRALPNLTFNIGLRWDFDKDILADGDFSRPCNNPAVAQSGCIWLRDVLGTHNGPETKNFGPRIGFAWDPFRKGTTVVRGGYGIYYDRVVVEVPILEELLDDRIIRLEVRNGSTLDPVTGKFLPDPVTGQIVNLVNPFGGGPATAGVGINIIDNNAKHPRVQQFTLGLQRQIGTNWVVSADGVHNFGDRLLIGRFLRSTASQSALIHCPDGVTPCTVTDPLTGLSDNITNIESSAKSWYDGLLTSLAKRPTGRGAWKWGFNLSYTLSKTFNYSNDDQIPFNGAEDAQNLAVHINNIRTEKGFSSIDERHRIVFSGVFEMPHQLSVSPILTISSRVPIDSFVPSLSSRLPILPRNALGREIQTGAELNAVIDVWNSLASCGNAIPAPFPCNPDSHPPGDPARVLLAHTNPNQTFGDWFDSLDLRVTKSFSITERQGVQLIGEVFNIFNITNIRGFFNTNYSGFSNVISTFDPAHPGKLSPVGAPISTAGGFFGSGGPRAFQFALR